MVLHTTMTYVTPETFNMYIENYNISGSEADKQTALKHFYNRETIYSIKCNRAGTIEAGTVIEIPEGFGKLLYIYGMATYNITKFNAIKLREQAGMNF